MPASAFKTDPNKVSIISIHDAAALDNQLNPGTWVNITVLIKNLSNDTMRNVNVSQSLPNDLEIVRSPFGNLTDVVNITTPAEMPMADGKMIHINSAFFNKTYYRFNFDSLINGSGISFAISVNATRDKVFDIDPVTVDYLDHWGDPHTVTGNRVSLEFFPIEEKSDDDLYYPKFEVTDVDWTLVISTTLAVIIGASILSALVYFRKPFSTD